MSLNVKLDDLFGGLSDSDASISDDGLDTEPMNLLHEMAMSCSSDGGSDNYDDADDEEEVSNSRSQTSKSWESQSSTSELNFQRTTQISEAIESFSRHFKMKPTVFDNETSKSSSSCSQHSFDGSQRKRKFESVEEEQDYIIAQIRELDKLPFDGLDSLTNLLAPAPKQAKLAEQRPVKQMKCDDYPYPKRRGLLVSCPSSSTPVQNVSLLSQSFEARKEIGGLKHSKKDVEELKQLEHLVMLGNFSKEQLERYEVYRRSNFKNSTIKKIIEKTTGAPVSDKIVISIRSLAKMLVGDLVEEAVELRERLDETDEPIQPRHIKAVFKSLTEQGKLWPPYSAEP